MAAAFLVVCTLASLLVPGRAQRIEGRPGEPALSLAEE
jgi:hypothetical protein